MKKETLLIAIFVALIILWITETLGMKKTSRLLGGAIDVAFSLFQVQQLYPELASDVIPDRLSHALFYDRQFVPE